MNFFGQRRVCVSATLLAFSFAVAACGQERPAETAASGSSRGSVAELAVATAPATPPRPASQRILGTWEYQPPTGSVGPVLRIEFAPELLRRSTNGRETSAQQWVIVDETADDVAIEVTQLRHGRSTRDRWRLLDDSRLIHEAAPEVVYTRVAEYAPPVGGGSGEGSGAVVE